jgi:hypothetical protein
MFCYQILQNIIRISLQPVGAAIGLIVSTRGDGRSHGVKRGIHGAG